jgi:hypothetical protein
MGFSFRPARDSEPSPSPAHTPTALRQNDIFNCSEFRTRPSTFATSFFRLDKRFHRSFLVKVYLYHIACAEAVSWKPTTQAQVLHAAAQSMFLRAVSLQISPKQYTSQEALAKVDHPQTLSFAALLWHGTPAGDLYELHLFSPTTRKALPVTKASAISMHVACKPKTHAKTVLFHQLDGQEQRLRLLRDGRAPTVYKSLESASFSNPPCHLARYFSYNARRMANVTC